MNFELVVEKIKRNIEPYQTEPRSFIYLALNENPYSFPEELIQQCFETMDPTKMNLYVEAPLKEFLKELVEYVSTNGWRAKEEQISVGNGADEIIYVLLLMFKDLSIYVFPPTYSCYEIFANALGVKVNKIALKEEKIDVNSLKEVLNEGCVVFLPNPNNPTGHLFKDEEISWLLNTKALLVLDEAYYEFCGKTFAPLIDEFSNLIILRTFSKAFALASQRIGYILADPSLIDAYNRIRLPYNVSYLGQICAMTALRNRHIFQERVKKIVEERERLKTTLKSLGLNVSDSQTNFVFVYLKPDEAWKIYSALLDRGITVRMTELGLRISVGQPQQNDLLIETMEGLL
ncbi:MAG: Histidinol-phosphate aminotransferase [Thermotoga sp. 50_1627]|uniref:histidinol-phosphate transaminase n=1 Tax=Pseudothermotoga sp. TaxID=2033661 RepID=UPI00076C5AC9|nr:MAG: Histidinol-phosphate aminotransferase [Thermotoga sp. 50_64]KUK24150.1 MAG: Histidinol-phosphate aminotransferase [Thermotoga sp. 50_1627]MDK2923924.1 histidinol-phosphate aminotransferase [Pseudothermotoga sp.]